MQTYIQHKSEQNSLQLSPNAKTTQAKLKMWDRTQLKSCCTAKEINKKATYRMVGNNCPQQLATIFFIHKFLGEYINCVQYEDINILGIYLIVKKTKHIHLNYKKTKVDLSQMLNKFLNQATCSYTYLIFLKSAGLFKIELLSFSNNLFKSNIKVRNILRKCLSPAWSTVNYLIAKLLINSVLTQWSGVNWYSNLPYLLIYQEK